MMPAYPLRSGDDILLPSCAACGRWRWPGGEICRDCGGVTIGPARWTGPATVLAEVRVHRGVPAANLEHGPYEVVAIDLGGLRFLTRWGERPDPVRRGQRCTLRWGRVGDTDWPLAYPQDA
ncbi:Zn-ribbon domain-containing OB-fold protein [Microbacterium sp. 18062]|uniref:Zn-ribbon domain-containing OB-fold protein n=1 Tax=Microbacterium sp. 18062 TaxID=2681410 RepID=UPI00135B9AF3|nr:hypothetical protein [Microbacterium sp. 18062]